MGFLSLLTAFVPPLVGTLIADYWIINKGDKDKFEIRPGFYAPGMISFFCGAFVACLTGGTFASFPALAFLNVPFFIGPVNGIIVSMLVYILLAKLVPGKAQEAAG
jgi:cytosine permease